jgi:BirA family biotin operon repressor/biotin-[acetyl-CoA-carboxylase] ligase
VGAHAGPPAGADARLFHIVRLLQDNAMVVVSGTKIAAEIGTSRSEVWRLVQQLRRSGVEITGRPATGYRLEAVPDLLLPETIAPLVKGTIFAGHILHYFKLGSTNLAAMEAAAAGEAEGTAFLAEEQTSGRGRGGHSWHSEQASGIYCSVILRPQLSPVEVLSLSLAAGLAAAIAVEEVTGVRGDLRWPNDLLVPPHAAAEAGKKFCGILAEMNAEATRIRYLVVGIGINVNQEAFPPDLEPVATSLRRLTGRRWSRVDLAAALLKSLDCEYRNLADGARHDILRRFEQHSSFVRGRQVHVDEEEGYEGLTDGLDERGFLRVRTVDGIRTVLSGSVR